MSGGSVLPFYFIAGWVAPTKPRELEYSGQRGAAVLARRPRLAGARARDIRSRFKDIDRRLADIESYVTTENRSLAREIERACARQGRGMADGRPGGSMLLALLIVHRGAEQTVIRSMLGIIYPNRRILFKLWREKKLESEGAGPASPPRRRAQYAVSRSHAELEQRVRVLEQNRHRWRGAETAAQIEALRQPLRPARTAAQIDVAAARWKPDETLESKVTEAGKRGCR